MTRVHPAHERGFDIEATRGLHKLYAELLKDNPEWRRGGRRCDRDRFVARLIFCFFAQETLVFPESARFRAAFASASGCDASKIHESLGRAFGVMNPSLGGGVPGEVRRLFSGSVQIPRFGKSARSCFLELGSLNWKAISPSIFGSMTQSLANPDERGELGMHYTSAPDILKVLNPLFLDGLRQQLDGAGRNSEELLRLRDRLLRIRVFDPACGTGNFLVLAYQQMRAIESEINKRRAEEGRNSEILISNFRGIELREFSAQLARLALFVAKGQCDAQYSVKKQAYDARPDVDGGDWIVHGNALSLDWLELCPPLGSAMQSSVDEGDGEVYICGNPPFSGTRTQSAEQKRDLERVFSRYSGKWRNVDYVGAWLIRAAEYNQKFDAPFAFVATNSLCQGQQVPITWKILTKLGLRIRFACSSFLWSNLASNQARVTVVIVGLDGKKTGNRSLFTDGKRRSVTNINPYLTEHEVEIVTASKTPLFVGLSMEYGVYYSKSAGLILSEEEALSLQERGFARKMMKHFWGSSEYINGKDRYCLWIADEELEEAQRFPEVRARIESVREDRKSSADACVNKLAGKSHQFRERKGDEGWKLLVPIVSSVNREYLPVGLVGEEVVPTNKAFFISDPPMWALAVLSSKLHLAWIEAICGRLRSDYSYSNTLGWNTFPLPELSEMNKRDLHASAESILEARHRHFPATLAQLYEVKKGASQMPKDLRRAHEHNDEVLERIYIGRPFKSNTERLATLFSLYTSLLRSRLGSEGAGWAISAD